MKRPAQLLVLSAETATGLEAAAQQLADHLEAHPEVELAEVALNLQTGSKALDHRRIAVARDSRQAVVALRGPAIAGRREGPGPRPVVFLFPGLGDQRVDMARELYETEPFFRSVVDDCAGKLSPWLGANLREVLFSPGEWRPSAAAKPDLRALLRRGPQQTSRLDQTLFAQPACFVVEYALGRLLLEWGIAPHAMIGYSVGEYVAACLSGALALEDALELVARRAKLIQDLPGGAMLAIPLTEEEALPLLGESLSLSATNGPHFCVLAGPAAAMEAVEKRLTEQGASCLRIRTTHAFHSRMMEPAAGPLAEIARRITMREPRIPFVSNVTGARIAAADLADPTYWVRHMLNPVRFAEGIGELLREPESVFLEVGPGMTLGTLIKQHPSGGADRITVSTLREGSSDLESVLGAVGRLWIAGAEVDWIRFHGGTADVVA